MNAIAGHTVGVHASPVCFLVCTHVRWRVVWCMLTSRHPWCVFNRLPSASRATMTSWSILKHKRTCVTIPVWRTHTRAHSLHASAVFLLCYWLRLCLFLQRCLVQLCLITICNSVKLHKVDELSQLRGSHSNGILRSITMECVHTCVSGCYCACRIPCPPTAQDGSSISARPTIMALTVTHRQLRVIESKLKATCVEQTY